MKKIVSAILVVLIAYGSLKTYLNYQITTDLNEMIADLKDYAVIEYQSVSTNLLTQKIAVSDIVIQPTLTHEDIVIDEIRLLGADFFKRQDYGLKDFQLNSHKNREIQIKGLTLDLHSEFFSSPPFPFSMEHNNALKQPPSLLKELGYEILKINFSFAYDPNPKKQHWVLHFNHQQEDMFTLSSEIILTAELPVKSDQSFSAMLYNYQTLQLQQGFLKYQDNSLLTRYTAFKAQKEGKPLETIQQNSFLAILDTLSQHQILLSEKTLQAIQNFIHKPNTIQFKVEPNSPLNLDKLWYLFMLSPSELPEALNLEITQ
ncbi:MAG TPA: hypothetical protein VJ205_03830 [Gammaproteobacteria bacterium]|nr:hypothetical protein [Gammaproteobacteria bacterium]